MSVPVIRELPSGRFQIWCPGCQTSAVTPFREVARRDAQKHVCPRPGREGGDAA